MAGEASATLVTVDGISLEVNNGGQIIKEQFDRDTLVTAIGDTLQGVGLVSQIQNTLAGVTYLAPCAPVGCSGTFLTDVFGGFVVRDIVPNGSNTGFDVYLTGGFLDYYVLNARPDQNAGSVALDIANSMSSTLFLHLVPQVFDAFGDTFHIFIPGDNLATFSGNAQGDALLDVAGGDAAAYFDTNGFTNGFSGAKADFNFIGNATRLQRSATDNRCPPTTGPNRQDFCVQGSDNLINIQPAAIPEPGSLLLFATGLLSLAGATWARRRRLHA